MTTSDLGWGTFHDTWISGGHPEETSVNGSMREMSDNESVKDISQASAKSGLPKLDLVQMEPRPTELQGEVTEESNRKLQMYVQENPSSLKTTGTGKNRSEGGIRLLVLRMSWTFRTIKNGEFT